MKNWLAAVLLFTAAAPARSAVDSETFAHPQGDYVLKYPVGWKRGYGVQALILRPALKGGAARFHIERHGIAAGDAPSPADYAKSLRERTPGVRKLVSATEVTVGGRPGRRLEFVETKPLKGPFKTPLAGPMREVHLIVPLGKAYYVLYWEGYGEDSERFFLEFEAVAASVSWGAK